MLLTTHYVEEAANADLVAFLRGGRILLEGQPADLLEKFSTRSLETIFLQLCTEEDKKISNSDSSKLLEDSVNEINTFDDKVCRNHDDKSLTPLNNSHSTLEKLSEIGAANSNHKVKLLDKTKALLFKNLMVLRRHRLFMMFNVILPVLNFAIFYQAVGKEYRTKGTNLICCLGSSKQKY